VGRIATQESDASDATPVREHHAQILPSQSRAFFIGKTLDRNDLRTGYRMPAAGVKDGAKPDSWGVSSSLASSALCERPVAQGPMKRLQPSVGACLASPSSPSASASHSASSAGRWNVRPARLYQ
jgi:hypothetical protein